MCCVVPESGVRVALSRVAEIGVGIRTTTVYPVLRAAVCISISKRMWCVSFTMRNGSF